MDKIDLLIITIFAIIILGTFMAKIKYPENGVPTPAPTPIWTQK